MLQKLMQLLAMGLCCSSYAGKFTIVDQTSDSISITYTGTIEEQDVDRWREIKGEGKDRTIKLLINSRGGKAKASVDLFWELHKYPKLITIAGNTVGAWSGAAIMWLGGKDRQVEAGAMVMFHAPYCNWDEESNPDIGCNIDYICFQFEQVFTASGFNGQKFIYNLRHIQQSFGTDGWLGILGNMDKWYMIDTGTLTITRFDIKGLQ
jgi:hypothetical protein